LTHTSTLNSHKLFLIWQQQLFSHFGKFLEKVDPGTAEAKIHTRDVLRIFYFFGGCGQYHEGTAFPWMLKW